MKPSKLQVSATEDFMKKLQLVNIKQGTKSVPRFSNGNTLPLVQLPFGMAAFAPQTQVNGTWFYHPDDRCVEGIRLTHQPSPWIGDYGTFLMTPQNDNIAGSPAGAWSGYRPAEAVMTPAYLKLRFLRAMCDFELTPTERGALCRLTFHTDRPSVLSLFPVLGNCHPFYQVFIETLVICTVPFQHAAPNPVPLTKLQCFSPLLIKSNLCLHFCQLFF
jgi:putative alpha-1,2-mannosidase